MIAMKGNQQRTKLKTVLWGIVGVLFGVAVKAFLLGLGTTTRVPEVAPFWMKGTVIFGIAAGSMLVFIFFMEKRGTCRGESRVNPEDRLPRGGKEDFDPFTMKSLLPNSLAAPRRYSLAALTTAVTVIALLPQSVLLGAQPESTPVSAARTMKGPAVEETLAADQESLTGRENDRAIPNPERFRLMIVDGNRRGRLAIFPHDEHVSSIGGENPCGFCHHENLPFDQNSSCFECHRDMYAVTDIFSHSSHIDKLDGNDGCAVCHENRNRIKTRMTARPCGECHADMLVEGSFVEPEPTGLKGYAVGYKEAMHGLCVTCHEESDPDLADCAVCHPAEDGMYLRGMGPYVTRYGKR